MENSRKKVIKCIQNLHKRKIHHFKFFDTIYTHINTTLTKYINMFQTQKYNMY
jgi:hypothetical protein